ncbi:hypothetical protein [Holospora curviuscula]|uniref:hypothetical protein n=1 Tax=Holospora curviuscula TaxID=1082868 RepID=UPI000CE5CAC5|nr:hypothetical protein [Holospora curviuscula]
MEKKEKEVLDKVNDLEKNPVKAVQPEDSKAEKQDLNETKTKNLDYFSQTKEKLNKITKKKRRK